MLAATELATAAVTPATAAVAEASSVTVANQERADAAAAFPEKPMILSEVEATSVVKAVAAVILALIESKSVPCAL